MKSLSQLHVPNDIEGLQKHLKNERTRRISAQTALIKAHGGVSDDPEVAQHMPVEKKMVPNATGTTISLGSLISGPAAPKKEFAKVLAAANVNQVFLKDFDQVWYQKGLMGLTSNREETADWVGNFLSDLPRPWHFIGASSGGFMALFLGHALQADTITTFSAQTIVTRQAVKTFAGEKPWKIGLNLEDPTNDLLPRFSQTPFTGRAELHFGTGHDIDLEQNERLGGCDGVTLCPHDYNRHSVAFHLRDKGELDSILERAMQAH